MDPLYYTLDSNPYSLGNEVTTEPRPTLKTLLTFFEDAKERQISLNELNPNHAKRQTTPPPLPPRRWVSRSRSSLMANPIDGSLTDISESTINHDGESSYQAQTTNSNNNNIPITNNVGGGVGIIKSTSTNGISQYQIDNSLKDKTIEELTKELNNEKYQNQQQKLLVKSLQEDTKKLNAEVNMWKTKYNKLYGKFDRVRGIYNQLHFVMNESDSSETPSGYLNSSSSSINNSSTNNIQTINTTTPPTPTTMAVSPPHSSIKDTNPNKLSSPPPPQVPPSSPISSSDLQQRQRSKTLNEKKSLSSFKSQPTIVQSTSNISSSSSSTTVQQSTSSSSLAINHNRHGSSTSVKESKDQLSSSYGIEMDEHHKQDLTEEEYMAMIEHRKIIAHQILKTEREYASSLFIIVEEFFNPLSAESYHSSNPFISSAQVKQVFGEVKVILGASILLIEDLDKLLSETSNVGLGDVFLKTCDYFKLYSPYVTNYYTSISVLNKLKEESHKFQTFIHEKEHGLDSAFSDLGSLLLLPLNRIGQYTTMLTDLWRSTPTSHPDFGHFNNAVNKMKSILDYVKEKTREYESQNKVRIIQDHLIQSKDSKIQNLNEPHRRYVKEGLLTEVNPNRTNQNQLHVFLFNDLMIVTLPVSKKNQYVCKKEIKLTDAEVLIVNNNDEDKPTFQILFPSDEKDNQSNSNNTNILNGIINGSILQNATNVNNITNNNNSDQQSNSDSVRIRDSYTFSTDSIRDRDDWVSVMQQYIAVEKKKAATRKTEDISVPRGGIDFQNSDIQVCEQIGSGGSGCTVHRCTVDGFTCAVKVLKLKNTQAYLIDQFVSEITIMEQLNHQNIAKYLGHRLTSNPERLWLYMEYYPYSLKDIITKRSAPFPYSEAIWMALEIAKGIEFLHSQKPPIIHRDVKPANIMCSLDERNSVCNIRVCDFDTSKIISSGVTLKTCIGSPLYMAPEVLDINTAETSDGYSIKADIWSYAMLVFEIITLLTPYHHFEHLQAIEMILRGTPPPIPTSTPSYFQPLIDILITCIDLDPKKRPSSKSICEKLTKLLKSSGKLLE